MVAIAAAYILLPTAPPDTTINVVPQLPESPVRLFPKQGLSSIAFGSMVLGICLMMYKSPWPEVGLSIAVLGGALCLGVSLGVMVGWCNYSEIYMQEVLRAQKDKLGEVLAEYGVGEDMDKDKDTDTDTDTDANPTPNHLNELEALINGRRERVSFDSRHGTLVTERMGDGYLIELQQGEKDPKRAELVRGADIGGGVIKWTETARSLVSPEWAGLLDLYV
jgi:hypothetical protein